MREAKKFSGKFDVFALKHFTLEIERVMNAFLQVMTHSMHNSSVFGRDLQKSDHVTLVDQLLSIRR